MSELRATDEPPLSTMIYHNDGPVPGRAVSAVEVRASSGVRKTSVILVRPIEPG